MSLEGQEVQVSAQTKKTKKSRKTKKASSKKSTKSSKSSKTTKATKGSKKRTRKAKSAPEPVQEEAPVVQEENMESSASVPEVQESAAAASTEQVAESSSQDSATVESEKTAEEQSVEVLISSLSSLNESISGLYSHIKGITGSKNLTQIYKQYKNTRRLFTKLEDELSTQTIRSVADAERRAKSKRTRRASTSTEQKKNPVVPALTTFMGLDEGTPVSRTEILRAISGYVREQKLQIEGRRRSFVIDDKLKTLFPEHQEMQYTQIMGQISSFYNLS